MESYTTKWRSPSNIALVKYWGKKENQIPQNPSISFTLSQAYTETRVTFSNAERFGFDFLFEGKKAKKFMAKLNNYFACLLQEMPYLNQYFLQVDSKNSFPHSTGIASSASAMSALALCLVDFERKVDSDGRTEDFYQRASTISRLGSGSACRSVYPKISIWGKYSGLVNSTDLYASAITDSTHHNFLKYQDTILIISTEPKEVSSTLGHGLMKNNPYAINRFRQAEKNTSELLDALYTGDLQKFGILVEEEALSLHALMMCSQPGFILMKPNTLKAISAIKTFREESKLPVCFTLDAGPNIHLLYPDNIKKQVADFINLELKQYCKNGKILYDYVGDGPQKLAS